MTRQPFYYRQTGPIRITVRPIYLPDESYPDQDRYVFAYFVRIENVGRESMQLRSRRWLITDSIGEETEVSGDGVVGEQPKLSPGAVHEYQSYCVLKSPHGAMEGQYIFTTASGTFTAQIPRFELEVDAEPTDA